MTFAFRVRDQVGSECQIHSTRNRWAGMIALNVARIGKFVRGVSVRQIRMVCGLILFTYLISHFLNHALGNISLEAMAWGLHYHVLFWQFLPVAIVFYAAVLIHGALGIWALYERRQFRWKTIEPLQLVLGLSVPALIASHVIGTRLGHTLFGHDRLYPQVLHGYWATMSTRFWLLLVVLVVAWVHGSIGLYFWLRMKSFFRRAAPFLLAAAVLVPALALLGFYQGGRTVMKDSADPQWRAANLSAGSSARRPRPIRSKPSRSPSWPAISACSLWCWPRGGSGRFMSGAAA